jgi:acyl-CoA synthetase (AMP-forming)/AMP-acid ligase II
MTETGMTLSNPYSGTRHPGSVGSPLPGVEVRIIKPQSNPLNKQAKLEGASAPDGTDLCREPSSQDNQPDTNGVSVPEPSGRPLRKLALDEENEEEILREAEAAQSTTEAKKKGGRLRQFVLGKDSTDAAPSPNGAESMTENVSEASVSGSQSAGAPRGRELGSGEARHRSASGGDIEGGGLVEEGAGQLAVKGPGLFKEYWRQPDATAAAFDAEGFFRTGMLRCLCACHQYCHPKIIRLDGCRHLSAC